MRTISNMIDHTLLKPNANKEDIENLCREAIEYNFKAVCINPYYVSLCRDILKNTNIHIATVIGFPLGNNKLEVKALEAKLAVEDGADEIDMVINIPAAKMGNYKLIEDEIKAIKNLDVITKVIIEACYLEPGQIVRISQICKDLKVDFVKTSTGFGEYGARIEDVRLIKSVVGEDVGIKASGGISNYTDVERLIEAGATRIGSSKSIQIIKTNK